MTDKEVMLVKHVSHILQPFTGLTRGLKSYIIPRHKLGKNFCGHKYLKSRFVVAILNFSKITCTFPDSAYCDCTM